MLPKERPSLPTHNESNRKESNRKDMLDTSDGVHDKKNGDVSLHVHRRRPLVDMLVAAAFTGAWLMGVVAVALFSQPLNADSKTGWIVIFMVMGGFVAVGGYLLATCAADGERLNFATVPCKEKKVVDTIIAKTALLTQNEYLLLQCQGKEIRIHKVLAKPRIRS
jgi:hypothetical protein